MGRGFSWYRKSSWGLHRCPELLPLSKRTGLKCSDHLPRFQKSPHSICSYYLFKEAHPIPNTYDWYAYDCALHISTCSVRRPNLLGETLTVGCWSRWILVPMVSFEDSAVPTVVFYPLVNVYITMENHHFNGKIHENPLFLWPFSIANC